MNDHSLHIPSVTPSSTGEIVVPDTIEPIMGWKALRILPDGRLASPQQETIWPVKQRCEATCNRVIHSWQAVKTNRPNEAPPVVQGGGSSMMVSSVSYVATAMVSTTAGGGSMSMYPNERPSLVLPRGYKWSWEPSTHDPAQADCTCGFYLVTDPRKCSSYLQPDCVLCEIALWGNVVPAAEGARGQYAYPQKMYSLEHLADVAVLVSDLYGIPLEVRDNQKPGEKRPTPTPDPGSPAHLQRHLPDPPAEPVQVKPAFDPKQKLGTTSGRPDTAKTIAVFVYAGLLATILITTALQTGAAAVGALLAALITLCFAILVMND